MNTLSINQAKEKAIEIAKDLLNSPDGLQIEEIIHDKENKKWKFTFSYITEATTEFEKIIASNVRKLKTIELSEEDGEFLAMLINDKSI